MSDITRDIQMREAKPSDAKNLNTYIREIYSTSDHLITHPAEFKMGVWRQRQWISNKNSNAFERCFVATSHGEIVGMLDNWVDRRRRIRHSTCFSMSVKKGWRCKGVGSALLDHFIKWVKSHDELSRIELHVHSDNNHAIELYQSNGFEIEGTRKRTIRYADGREVDDHLMALWP